MSKTDEKHVQFWIKISVDGSLRVNVPVMCTDHGHAVYHAWIMVASMVMRESDKISIEILAITA